MFVEAIRSSSLSTYKDCQWKYFLEYLVGFESLAGKSALLGTICHAVLEVLAKCKKTGHYKLKDKYSDPDYVLDICWNSYFEEYKNTFDLEKADYTFCKKIVATVLSSPLNPLELNIIATEKQFEVDIQKPAFEYKQKDILNDCVKKGFFKLRGTIDLITEIDKDTLHIIDWKTGVRKDWLTGKPKEWEDFFKDNQLRLYDLVLDTLYPEYKYKMLTICFIRDGGPFTVSFSDEDRKNTLNDLRKAFLEISQNNKPTRLKDDFLRKDQQWKCRYVCSFGKTKDQDGRSQCDTFYNLFQKQSFESATKALYQINISAKKKDVSRRNDYSHNSITRAIIQD